MIEKLSRKIVSAWNILRAGITWSDFLLNLIFPFLLFVFWYAHLFHCFLAECHPEWLTIILVDAYLFFLILLAALRLPRRIPQRQIALISIPALFLVLVMSFAEVYIQNGHFARYTVHSELDPLQGTWDAAYFSLVTITTVGYGDYTPQEGDARMLVMAEILSGGLLLFFAFPVLGSRLANFDEPNGTTTIRQLPEGGWEIRKHDANPIIYSADERVTVTVGADGSIKLENNAL
jgi:hypothetical protein